VKQLQSKLESLNKTLATTISLSNELDWNPVPSVMIARGTHKYVLITARSERQNGGDLSYFVTSKHGAHYHRNAAEAFLPRLEERGYTDIQVLGGGRINLDEERRRIEIYGYSYGFGRADHLISKKVIEADEKYSDYDVTWSNDGY